MKHTWRWFGPHDRVSIDDMLQAGVEGAVTALHHLAPGTLWPVDEIKRRQRELSRMSDGRASPLKWSVVESLPVSEDIKKQQGEWRAHLENYRLSLANLAECGIQTICYNFMPVLDWTRTELAWQLPHGGTCMRFDAVDFAVFDVFLLKRKGASEQYTAEMLEAAEERLSSMNDVARQTLLDNVSCGLPGAADTMTIDEVRQHLNEYAGMSPETLHAHHVDFLSEVVPVAEALGLRLCCHPDDPPWALLGLPRVMSVESDFNALMSAVDTPANGITLCSGSLGARPDNDLPGMMRRLGARVHFLHLRNVQREGNAFQGSFHEAAHLEGSTDMVALIQVVLDEEAQRLAAGREDHQIPMRPDHGQNLLDDLTRQAQPGYPAIGRLRGLAELRGVERALLHRPSVGAAS